MTDEDSDTPVSELQGGEENDLPVIQLCGLVEELRYGRPASGGSEVNCTTYWSHGISRSSSCTDVPSICLYIVEVRTEVILLIATIF